MVHVALLAALAVPAAAQDSAAAGVPRGAAPDSTTAALSRARRLYEQLEIERAVPLFRQVISPAWAFEVSPSQRVEAYKYLGASLTLMGMRDSAVAYFRAALERDPFTDLDPLEFTPDQITAFGTARRATFAVGVRPVAPGRADPRTERLTFSFVTTHAATVRAELRSPAAATGVVLLAGESDGLHELRWDGLLPNGQLAPSGRYQLVVAGRSRLTGHADSARAYFDLAHEVPPLDDTLPELRGRDLLPERYTPRADLLKGVGIAAGALLIRGALPNGDLGGGNRAMPALLAGAAVATGVVAFLAHRHGGPIAEHIATNQSRQTARRAANAAIARRNAEKLAQTILVVSPASGAGP